MSAWPWPAPVSDGAAQHLVAGTRLPDVVLAPTRGGPVNLSRRNGPAILFVYPFTGAPGQPNPPNWDTIPGAHGSTPEAEGFRDNNLAFEDLGYEIFGLSGQLPAYQLAFAARVGLPFPVLSDADFAFADGLRLPRFETGGVTYLKRITFIVRNGVIEQTVYPVHPPDRHAGDMLVRLCESPLA
jgi:peroxiredoxin